MWKPWFIRFVFEHSDVQNVFWMDSGIMTFDNTGLIFEHIEKCGFWLTEEEGWINYNFKHTKCQEIMNVTQNE